MKTKLLFLIHALNPAGAQKVLVRMVNALDKEKYDITIKTIYKRHELKSELDDNVKLCSVLKTTNPFFVRFFGFLIRRVIPSKWTVKHLIGVDYDYQIAYLEGESTKLLAGSPLPKERKIAWVHVNLMQIFVSQKLYRTIEQHKKTYQSFGKIICVSEGVRTSFYQRFGDFDNVGVLYNVIDASQIDEKVLAYKPSLPSCFNIIMVGNCRTEKGYDRLFRIAKKLKEEFSFHITVCGSGSEYNNLAALKKNLGLDNYIDMKGQVDNPYPYIKESDLLVCSSYDEGFSTAVVESLIIGTPTLTTDCSGMSEILDNGKYGIIVPNSESGLYKGIRSILSNPEILNKYRELIPERRIFFSKEKAIGNIEKLFEI